MHFIGFFVANLIAVTLGSYMPHYEMSHHQPQPYKFGYSVKDHHGEQHREEYGDGHNVRGSYGFTDDRGIHRQVHYVADHAGFRAEVKTNEPGTASQNPAAVLMVSSSPVGGNTYGQLGRMGNNYNTPLYGGFISGFDSRNY